MSLLSVAPMPLRASISKWCARNVEPPALPLLRGCRSEIYRGEFAKRVADDNTTGHRRAILRRAVGFSVVAIFPHCCGRQAMPRVARQLPEFVRKLVDTEH
jgi:hypothetical protein